MTDAMRVFVEFVANNAEVRAVTGAGHGGHFFQPKAVADGLVSFLVSSPTAGALHAGAARA